MSPTTVAGDGTTIGHLLDFFKEDPPIDNIPARAQAFIDHLVRRGYQPGTVCNYAARLYAFCEWAELGRPDLKLPASPEPDARFWSDEELVQLREATDYIGPCARLAFEVAVGCGARQQELFALGWRQLDEPTRGVRIVEQLDRDRPSRRRALKSKKARTALVLPSLWTYLDGAVPDWRTRVGLILVPAGGVVYGRRAQCNLMRDILAAARLRETGVAWHACRHTYSRLVLEGGGALEQLRVFLGHANITTTDRIYGHLTEQAAIRLARQRIFGTT